MPYGSRYSGAIDPLSVVATIEANVGDWLSTLAELVPEASVVRHANVTLALFPFSVPLVNAVTEARFDECDCADRIAEVTRTYVQAGAPVVWWLGPSTRPVDLPKRLMKQGYAHVETLVGMAADLHRGMDAADRGAQLEWREVAGPGDVEQWAVPFEDGFGAADGLVQALAAAYSSGVPPEDGVMRLFVGYDRAEPVTSLLLHMRSGVAGLYGVATAATARGKGFAPGLVRHALQAARERGCRMAVLHSTSMAVSMYRSLGFMEYCRLRTYTHIPRHTL